MISSNNFICKIYQITSLACESKPVSVLGFELRRSTRWFALTKRQVKPQPWASRETNKVIREFDILQASMNVCAFNPIQGEMFHDL